MNRLKGWIGGPGASEPPASVLAEWNAYSANDVAPTQADRLLASAEEGASAVTKFVGSSFKTVTGGVSGAASSVSSGVQRCVRMDGAAKAGTSSCEPRSLT
jgi:hypothetical protein